MQELPPVYYFILNPCLDVYAFRDGIVFVVGMRRLGGIELQKEVRRNALLNVGLSRRKGKLGLRDRKAEGYLKQSGTLPRQGSRVVTVGTRTTPEKLRNSKKTFLATTTKRLDLNIYIVGAGA